MDGNRPVRLGQLSGEQLTVLDMASVAIAVLRDGRVEWVNRAFIEMFGCTLEEMKGPPDSSCPCSSEEYFERAVRDACQYLGSSEASAVEVELRRKSGEPFWCRLTGPQLHEDAMDDASIWVAQDVTVRRHAEATLRLIEKRLDTAQAQARIGSFEHGIHDTIDYWSPQMFRFFNLEPAQSPPTYADFLALLHPDDHESMKAAHQQMLETGQPVHIVYRRNPALGPLMVLDGNFHTRRDSDGRVLSIIGTLQDITLRHLAEESLRESQARLEAAQAQAHIGSWQYNPTTKQGIWSKEMVRLVGFDPKDAPDLAAKAIARVHPDDRERVAEVYRQAVEMGKPGMCEYQSDPSQGPERHFCMTCEVVRDAFGRPRYASGTLQEITERKLAEKEHARLQDQLQQAMKMEAVGRLAGGVAHDFNNLLTVILGNTELAKMDLDAADPLAQHLTEVTKAASSASDLTRQLLAFSRRQIIEPRVLNLNDLVGNLQNMLKRLIGEDISLETSLADDLGSVKVDPGQFDQLLINLAVNARDAMPDGGSLTVETANLYIDEAWCQAHGGLVPGDIVMLAVTDTGQGMSQEVRRHIFEPFFTTKPQGMGTGLGLATAFGIVKQAGGTIEVYSEPGDGTTFKIYLPRVEEPAQRLARDGARSETPGGHETILIVEDEASVRDLSAAFLRRQGYRVMAAASAGEAILCAETQSAPIDLLLADVVLPGMNGREVAERVQKTHPEAAVLFTSGYTEDTIVRRRVMADTIHFVGKPYSLQTLARKVRQVLDEHKRLQ